MYGTQIWSEMKQTFSEKDQQFQEECDTTVMAQIMNELSWKL